MDSAFPTLPFASREIIDGHVHNRVDEEYGEGSRHIAALPGDMRIMRCDYEFRRDASGPAVGQDFLKFHYKLNGRNVLRFAGRPDTLLETGRSVIAYHPEGLVKDDCFAAGVREVSLTIACRRSAILDLLRTSSDELPKPARRYFDCADSDFLCDELPLSLRMKEALGDLDRPGFSPWLQQIHVEAKVLDLICLSFHELTSRDQFIGPSFSLKARDIDMLHAVRTALESDFRQPITIPALCRQFATNRSKLSEGFRILFGETIFEYIHKLRMEHARLLLTDTDSPLSEIADQVGYSRQSSFSTAFRQHHGFRPLDVRRNSPLRATRMPGSA
ncbi:hypothetical protein ASE00_01500 [Sphingomonas sp. Root710]|uniref:helix-turn-helix transcriptional regulator n=1 Tax=Sphingomonas sp. Root710 TaxID=1736594 RepID=UPI0006FC987F|nr:AraC family transcriptional regulator [Sphingomonas sp. Root710]KRB85499.1 hypothetical protein ASE00_01500 [Sphingomonas sp. Root710]